MRVGFQKRERASLAPTPRMRSDPQMTRGIIAQLSNQESFNVLRKPVRNGVNPCKFFA